MKLLLALILAIFLYSSAFADGVVFATKDDLKAFDSLLMKSGKSANKDRVRLDSKFKEMLKSESGDISKVDAGSKGPSDKARGKGKGNTLKSKGSKSSGSSLKTTNTGSGASLKNRGRGKKK